MKWVCQTGPPQTACTLLTGGELSHKTLKGSNGTMGLPPTALRHSCTLGAYTCRSQPGQLPHRLPLGSVRRQSFRLCSWDGSSACGAYRVSVGFGCKCRATDGRNICRKAGNSRAHCGWRKEIGEPWGMPRSSGSALL